MAGQDDNPLSLDVKETPELFDVHQMGGAFLSTLVTSPFKRIQDIVQVESELRRSAVVSSVVTAEMSDFQVLRSRTINQFGYGGFWNGTLMRFLQIIPSRTIRNGTQKFLTEKFPIENSEEKYWVWLANKSLIAAGAGSLAMLVCYPLDVAAIRLSTDGMIGPCAYSAGFDGIKQALTDTPFVGIAAGFTGIFAYRASYIWACDQVEKRLSKDATEIHKFLSAYGASIFAGLIAYPFSTIRYRMILAAPTLRPYESAMDCYNQIVDAEGYAGLWKGAAWGIVCGFVGAAILKEVMILKDKYLTKK